MSTQDMAGKAAELKELKNMMDELAAEIAAIEDEIKAELTARGVDELTAGAFKIRYKTVQSSRFDTKGFRAAMPELAERFTIPTQTRRFTVA